MTIFVVFEEYGDTYTGYVTHIHKAFHSEEDAHTYIKDASNTLRNGVLDYTEVDLE